MSTSQLESNPLASINSKTLGASMPVITLGNGEKVPTGTIGALFMNIKTYDALIANRDNDPQTEVKLKELEDMFRAALPVMRRVGVLELFEPREWVEGGRSAGRKRVGELAGEWMGKAE